MSRRLYFLLVLVRLYFALQPSYIHPDEHFQGPEIITGEIFGWPTYKTWEFTSHRPIRSIFPLWLVYGPPLTVLKWVVEGCGYSVTPMMVFYALRLVMFLLSFVLEDWALHELLHDRRERATALLLVASSYVTWTFQMHTFSNSIETIIVLWCLVLMRKLCAEKEHTQVKWCLALGFLGVLGVFNRITFPAFLLVAGVQLLPHLFSKPLRLPVMLLAAGLTALFAVAMDTEYYTSERLHIRRMFSAATITPWNNLIYNLDSTNLAEHGLHPFWQHIVANLPQLLGPATLLLFMHSRKTTLFWSAIVGIAVLSCFRHQEPRFLLPAVPLLLSSIRIPQRWSRVWIAAWIAFNSLAAIVFGLYHQAGVVPMQLAIAQQDNVTSVLWWKTYSPPRWLLGEANSRIKTTDLMGMDEQLLVPQLRGAAQCPSSGRDTLLIAPSTKTSWGLAAQPLDVKAEELGLQYQGDLEQDWHVGLDDLDFAEDGIWPTMKRLGRGGLGVWRVLKWKDC